MEGEFIKFGKNLVAKDEFLSSGHRACQGCGLAVTIRLSLKVLGKDTIIGTPAGCWSGVGSMYPDTAWRVPWMQTLFENSAAVMSGVESGLRILMEKGRIPEREIHSVAIAGDGATNDIGVAALSGALERGHNFLYICLDNEAYMNTGIQRSGSTPLGTWTTTTPVGVKGDWEKSPKKNVTAIMAAHGIPYIATATTGYPEDLIRKVKKALSIKGTKFIQIFSPCPTGWKMDPALTVSITKEALSTRAFNLFEIENGVYRITMKPKKTPLKEYLMKQGRFRHMPDDLIAKVEAGLDTAYENLLHLEEFTQKKAGSSQ